MSYLRFTDFGSQVSRFPHPDQGSLQLTCKTPALRIETQLSWGVLASDGRAPGEPYRVIHNLRRLLSAGLYEELSR